jgi:hypothetical protein
MIYNIIFEHTATLIRYLVIYFSLFNAIFGMFSGCMVIITLSYFTHLFELLMQCVLAIYAHLLVYSIFNLFNCVFLLLWKPLIKIEIESFYEPE